MRSVTRRLPIALLTACLLAGASTVFLGSKLKRESATVRRPMLHYVTPARVLEPGEVLAASDLTWTQWPAESPVQQAVDRMDRAVGRVVLTPVDRGQPLLEQELAEVGAPAGLAISIPKGLRAVAFRSDEVAGVAGFLSPGSYVDVLVTYQSEHSVEPETATVLENARVLATGQQVKPDSSGKPTNATVVTLLLEPRQVERALLASAQGALHFALRNSQDRQSVQTLPVSLSNLTGAIRESNASQASAPTRRFRKSAQASLTLEQRLASPKVETVYGDGEAHVVTPPEAIEARP